MDMETESDIPDGGITPRNTVSGQTSKDRGSSKVDPSFKSKRYRDKLRTEIKALETLIPIDRSVLHRKLDSQTIFRLVISYFRLKVLFKAIGLADGADVVTNGTTEEERHIAEKYFEGRNISQILDGFLLVVATDGTILYASDNVLQYLGFNQVDLLHRCIYGVVHPDDHFDLKMVFEQPLIPGDSGCRQRRGDNQETARSTSFICRMKCFNGTAAGYLKIHCIGKIDNFPELSSKSTGSFLQVIRLYCQPFMLTGNDINDDVKQNVFWSKHDMDMKINELDKKAAAMTGYDVDELDGRSIYDFVHPEDVAAFASCHKSLVESTEVQTTYFRFITKDNDLIWLHSRGKVISKNSKKFSIVFTHCPVREEDSTFLQQESTIRQRFAINDLLQLIQYGYYTSNNRTNSDRCDSHVNHKTNGQICTPHIGFTEDASLSFYSALVSCPSTLHAMNDRHSPVLPSTHVAHKITQREKQLQFQEFRRRQEFEQDSNQSSADFLPYHWQMQQPVKFARQKQPQTEESHHQQYSMRRRSEMNVRDTKPIKSEPGCNASYQPCTYNPYLVFQDPRTNRVNCRPCVGYEPSICPLPTSDQLVFNLPPSPPVSPRKFLADRYAMYSNHQTPYYPSSFHSPSQRFMYSVEQSPYHFPTGCHSMIGSANNFPVPPIVQNTDTGTCFEPPLNLRGANTRNHTKPHANIRLSMHCDYSSPKFQGTFVSEDNKFHPYSSRHHLHSMPLQRQRMQSHIQQQGTCGQFNQAQEESIQYDIEASIHMKIVDNSMSKSVDSKQELDLPSIGSFLDYLNDS
ncbi:circadian locomoter output cycles protein kaput-like [Ylistrum balloti]|uniref:circadian locomoter output cycles protein kaput-like n=1 Tax=Ylistrum balloti TaxID=509963 RepID=UPI00290592C7|nr:circadian locomoter output cycles protein kaput-like [Ylistrum balloti]